MRYGNKDSSKLFSHLNRRLCVNKMAMKIMNLQKSFFIGFQPFCLGWTTNPLGETSVRSCSLLLRQPLIFVLLVVNMAIHALQFQNQIARVQKLTSKLFEFPSYFSFYTQMNSYCNTQMEVFLQ